MSGARQPHLASRLQGFGTNVFTEFTLLAQRHDAVNLGPAGTYFVLADIRPLGYDHDVEFCRMLPERVGVTAIPPTAFYVRKEAGRHLVRFAFCKTLAVLDEAVRRLRRLPRGKAA